MPRATALAPARRRTVVWWSLTNPGRRHSQLTLPYGSGTPTDNVRRRGTDTSSAHVNAETEWCHDESRTCRSPRNLAAHVDARGLVGAEPGGRLRRGHHR